MSGAPSMPGFFHVRKTPLPLPLNLSLSPFNLLTNIHRRRPPTAAMSDPITGSTDLQPITNVANDGDIVLTLDDKSRLRVQSKSLITASPVFQAMLDGRFREGQQPRSAINSFDLELKGDDPNALSRLCHMLQHKPVSPKLSSPGTQLVQELVAITEGADKYGCCAAISPQMESILWRFLASSALKTLSLADAKNLAAVSYFIDHAVTFFILTRALILDHHKPFVTSEGRHDVVHLSTEICLRLEDQRNAARLGLHESIPPLTDYISEACELHRRLPPDR
ncbi:hypothetical protein EJ03DRAFT_338353 [Teratosphaeria nubilosa]|uniref:BTB domain-containing protein n=1 Tax=Teratosphaeria nubilosa TaxID=161662 RepID=A0A6G1L1L1_9PEZI|nr:hypothetical protein EJ03DRAFT_338353 [Teratosphaeria nubilosa]